MAMVLAGCQSTDEPPAVDTPGDGANAEQVDAPPEAAPPASDDAPADAEAEGGPSGETDPSCLAETSNPFAESIVSTYQVAYDDVMAWYCGGYSFDNILLALETSKQTEMSVETLLDMNRNQSWEEIWNELGLVSTPNE